MPTGTWSKKDERQYKAIVASCLNGKLAKGANPERAYRGCKSMAAAIVNRRRAEEGRTKSKKSCSCPKGSRRMKTLKGWCYNPSTRRRARVRCNRVRRR